MHLCIFQRGIAKGNGVCKIVRGEVADAFRFC